MLKKITGFLTFNLFLFQQNMLYSVEQTIRVPSSTSTTSIWNFILYTVIFGFLGIILLICGYYIWELITPYNVKKQLVEEKNIASAIVVAAFIVGMAIIIGSALILIK